MQIRRVLALCVALVWVGTMSPTLLAQNGSNNGKQPKRSKQEQQDIDALAKAEDAAAAGQATPTDLKISWVTNHFTRSANGATYVPFILQFDPSTIQGGDKDKGVAVWVRLVSKDAAAPAAAPAQRRGGDDEDKPAPKTTYPWDDIFWANVPANGQVQRALAVKPGNYDLIVMAKERVPQKEQKNAPPLKTGTLKMPLTVPDFNGPDLQTSSVIIANSIEPVTEQLKPEQQQEQPYNFGALKVDPAQNLSLKKSGELQVIFWIYGAQSQAGKPNVSIDYSFYQKTGDTEKYFNKTAPQELSAQTLPPEFNTDAGHQLTGSLVVPLSIFPEGNYRLEIKITDKISGKTLTKETTFSAVAG